MTDACPFIGSSTINNQHTHLLFFSVAQTICVLIRIMLDVHTSASVRRSALWSVENFMESVFLPPFFMVMINSLLAGALTFGTMLTNSLYGHCEQNVNKIMIK